MKKDYFLNYFKVESSEADSEAKILDLDRNIFEDILGLGDLSDRSDQIDTSEDGLSMPVPPLQEPELATDPESIPPAENKSLETHEKVASTNSSVN